MDGTLQAKDSSRLLVAIELSNKSWRLALGTQAQARHCSKVIEAGDFHALRQALQEAKQRLGLAETADVVLCYEAGREGFYPQRVLSELGYTAWVIDAGSIEVPRGGRKHRKTDRLDAERLLELLRRYLGGERRALRVVRVPSREVEDLRQLPRERKELQKERNRVLSRIRALLFAQGYRQVPGPARRLASWLDVSAELGRQLKARLQHECAQLRLLEQQLAEVEKSERAWLKQVQAPALVETARRLCRLRAIDWAGAWGLSSEVFGWREFHNRREVAGGVGLAPTPYQSGELAHEQGIDKASNRRARALLVELGWLWLSLQPQSELTQWYRRRFAQGGKRLRKIGIVALARRLAVALWRYLTFGEIPKGAQLKAR